jgi:hypothetical protein
MRKICYVIPAVLIFTAFAFADSIVVQQSSNYNSKIGGGRITRNAGVVLKAHDGYLVHIYPTWTTAFSNKVEFIVSADKGATWTSPTTLTGVDNATPIDACISGDQSDTIYISYGKTKNMYLKKLTRVGNDWDISSSIVDVIANGSDISQTAIIKERVSPYRLWVTGCKRTSQGKIYVAYSDDDGSTWYRPTAAQCGAGEEGCLTNGIAIVTNGIATRLVLTASGRAASVSICVLTGPTRTIFYKSWDGSNWSSSGGSYQGATELYSAADANTEGFSAVTNKFGRLFVFVPGKGETLLYTTDLPWTTTATAALDPSPQTYVSTKFSLGELCSTGDEYTCVYYGRASFNSGYAYGTYMYYSFFNDTGNGTDNLTPSPSTLVTAKPAPTEVTEVACLGGFKGTGITEATSFQNITNNLINAFDNSTLFSSSTAAPTSGAKWLYLGFATKVDYLSYSANTTGVGGAYSWGYSTSTAPSTITIDSDTYWSTLDISPTSILGNGGYNINTVPGDWTTTTISGKTGYYIRIACTELATTIPQERQLHAIETNVAYSAMKSSSLNYESSSYTGYYPVFFKTGVPLGSSGEPVAATSRSDLKVVNVAYPAPLNTAATTITSVTPAALLNTTAVTVTINGSNFHYTGTPGSLTPPSASLITSSSVTIAASSIPVVRDNSLICVFDLSAASLGTGSVIVTNDTIATLASSITIISQAVVTAVTKAKNGATRGITITGNNFYSGAAVKFTKTGEADITAAAVNVTSVTEITATVNLTGVTIGAWDAVVTNTDSIPGTLTNGFTVYADSPAISSISPTNVTNNGLTLLSINGSNFFTGCTVKLEMGGQIDITPISVEEKSADLITCYINAVMAPPGSWTLKVTNVDGETGTTGIILDASAPTITSVTPSAIQTRTSAEQVTIRGTNYFTGSVAALKKSGQSDINPVSSSITGTTTMTWACVFNLSTAALGDWDVCVTNTDTKAVTLVEGLGIGSPVVSTVSPTTRNTATSPVILTVTGTGFVAPQGSGTINLKRTITYDVSSGVTSTRVTNIPSDSITEWTDTSIIATFTNLNRALGPWDVVVTNNNSATGKIVNGFTLTGSQNYTSGTLTGPTSFTNTGTVVMTVDGNYLYEGTRYKLTMSGVSDIFGYDVVSGNTTKATCNINVEGIAPGTYKLVSIKQNGDASETWMSKSITVTASAAPLITSISPTIMGNTYPTTATIIGTGLFIGVNAVLYDTATGTTTITANPVTQLSADNTTISAVFDMTGQPNDSKWNLTVTNADDQFDTKTSAVTVSLAPKINSISPVTAVNSGSIYLSVYGEEFDINDPWCTVKLKQTGSTDIIGTNVTVLSGAEIGCIMNLTGVNTGYWDVQVINNLNGTYYTLTNALTISPLTAIIKGASPLICDNSGARTLTVIGSEFMSGLATKLVYSDSEAGVSDIIGTETSVTGSSIFVSNYDVTGVKSGVWNIHAANPGSSGSSSLVNMFTILPAAPRIFTITPASGSNDATNTSVTIYGQYLPINPDKLYLTNSATKITVTGTVVGGTVSTNAFHPWWADSISFNIAFSNTAPVAWDVRVDYQDGEIISYGVPLTNGFTTTTSNVAEIASKSSTVFPNTKTSRVTIIGNYFYPGAGIVMKREGYADITALNTSTTGITRIRGDLPLLNADYGAWKIFVYNANGVMSIADAKADVTVYGLPVITSIFPTSGTNSTTTLLSIEGDNLSQVTKVTFDDYISTEFMGLSVESSQTCVVTIPPNISSGKYIVKGYSDAGTNTVSPYFDLMISKSDPNTQIVRAADGTKVIVPSGAFTEDTSVVITTLAPSEERTVTAGSRIAGNIIRILPGLEYTMKEFMLGNTSAAFNKNVDILIPFAGIESKYENKLKIFKLNTENNIWEYVNVNQETNAAEKYVRASINSFSIYRILLYSMLEDTLENAAVYPNPIDFALGGKMNFVRMTASADVTVYTIDGEKVITLYGNGSGKIEWDGKNESGDHIKRGLYIYTIKDIDGNKKTGKFAVK